MNANRKRTRKLLFQVIYAKNYNDYNEESFYESFYNGKFTFKVDKDYIKEISVILTEKKPIFNNLIKKFAPKFNIKNMNVILLIPIYIALCEMFFLKEEIPGKVSINEAIELTKYFGDESWKRIVNWILNKVLENFEELQKEIQK